MNARCVGAITVLASVGLVGCGIVRSQPSELPAAVHPETEEHRHVRTGHERYHSLCASCHGISGRGDGPMVADLRREPSDLTLIAARRGGVFPEHEIHEIIDGRRSIRGHGSATMPVWGRQFVRERADPPDEIQVRARILSIVGYLKTIQRPAP